MSRSPKKGYTRSDTSAYRMAINNAARYIRSVENRTSGEPVTAFDVSTVMAICFCMAKEDCIADLINAKVDNSAAK